MFVIVTFFLLCAEDTYKKGTLGAEDVFCNVCIAIVPVLNVFAFVFLVFDIIEKFIKKIQII